MLAFLVLGTLSTQLGAMAVIGFAVGDFFVFHDQWTTKSTFAGFGFGNEPSGLLANPVAANLIIERVPLLIEYGLIGTLTIGLPLGARGLAGSIAGRLRLPARVHFVVTAVLVALTAFVLGRLWAAAAPLVIRPMFSWTIDDGINQGIVPEGVITPIQDNIEWIGRVAALAVLGRAALLWLLHRASPRRIGRAESALLAPIENRRTRPGVLRSILYALLVAGLAVLFLAGMIDDPWAAAVLAGAFFVARLARSGLIPIPTRRWRAAVGQIPVLLRYGAALLVMNGVSKAVIASAMSNDNRLQFLTWPIAGAAVLFAFLMPESPRAAGAEGGQEATA
jgi:hypothetical protein